MKSLLRGMGVSGSTTPATPFYTPEQQQQQQHSRSEYQDEPYSQQHGQQHQEQQQILNQPPQPPTATELARRAPHAGFLLKMGSNIATYKRRFFVLQPSTQLYYFLSPHDTVPRGAIAIDEARVERLDNNNDCGGNNNKKSNGNSSNSSRLALHWPDGSTIQLEARSPEMAAAWCQSLQQERLPFVRAELEASEQRCAEAQCEIDNLKRQVEQYRFVEQDRDGALEDAQRWKQEFETLDESLRLLANHVRKLPAADEQQLQQPQQAKLKEEKLSPQSFDLDDDDEQNEEATKAAELKLVKDDYEHENVSSFGNIGDEPDKKDIAPPEEPEGEEGETKTESILVSTPETYDEPNDSDGEEKKEETDAGDVEMQSTATNDDNNKNAGISRDISLLDDDANAEETAAWLFQNNNIMEDLNAPGQHFSSLVNACQQLRENLRLASDEATTAVEDTKEAHTRAETLQTRMTKAEKQLCQLWEENCSIRKTLKQKKRERRVLVREVKSLMEQQLEHQQQQVLREAELQQKQTKTASSSSKGRTALGIDEERLINELEEHVVSSIRLHEEFLSPSKDTRRDQKISSSSTVTTAASTKSGSGYPSAVRTATKGVNLLSNSAQPAVSSLFDDSSSDSDSDSEAEVVNIRAQLGIAAAVLPKPGIDAPSASRLSRDVTGMLPAGCSDADARSISSVAASFGGDSRSIGRSQGNSPLRTNPILQLDQEEVEENREERLVDEVACFKPINVAQSGNATSRLVCPLADVVQTRPNVLLQSTPDVNRPRQEDLQIYHVTFYTRRIGIQFQKVPAPPTRARGLLTDAMTADLAGDAHGSSKTVDELKRVAAISNWATTAHDSADTSLQLATPVDAVLVCGFEGFDDSGNNVRPKLGSRLVAFDGVSVEIGKWTFDSIRKAIQARNRPLTLSFRNDFLTTNQRAIMTKVVSQMEKQRPMATPASISSYSSRPPSTGLESRIPRHEDGGRAPSAVPSLGSAPSHETAQFVNETTLKASNSIPLPDYSYQNRLEYDEDDLTVSTTGYYSDYQNSNPHPYQQQQHNPHQQQRRFTASSSNASYGSGRLHGGGGAYSSYRSFSEAGSSASALSAAIGPLMNNLMSGLSAEKKCVNMAPDYLRRQNAVENAPQHQDFQSNLL